MKKQTWGQRNPELFNAAWKRWYEANRAKKLAWQKRRLDEIRAWWWALKATLKCERCGEATPECLQFHHRDPKAKELELAFAISNRWKRERILAEMEKCDVLCANCHFKHHCEEREAQRRLFAELQR